MQCFTDSRARLRAGSLLKATVPLSHDWAHVHRVRKQAVDIAQQEGLEAHTPGGVLVVELAALLHDVKDYKYSGSDSAGGSRLEISALVRVSLPDSCDTSSSCRHAPPWRDRVSDGELEGLGFRV